MSQWVFPGLKTAEAFYNVSPLLLYSQISGHGHAVFVHDWCHACWLVKHEQVVIYCISAVVIYILDWYRSLMIIILETKSEQYMIYVNLILSDQPSICSIFD